MKRGTLCVTVIGCALLFSVIVFRAGSTETVTTQPTMQARTVSAPSGAQSGLAKNKPRLLEAYGKVPLSFEPNRGQADPRVKLLSRRHGYSAALTSKAVHSPILILLTTTIKAIAVADGWSQSPVASAQYKILLP